MKSDGTIRLEQDFRDLNNESYTDKYSMKDVSKCIGEIGRSGNTIFSTIDRTAGFWQMILHPRARPYTTFTVSPMGLLCCLASFQCLVETVVDGISYMIVYFDDLLVPLATHEEHLATLGQVLKHLVQHRIKINLQKCFFKQRSGIPCRLTEEGIKLGTDKLKAVKNAPLPSSVHEVQQFLGLCPTYIATHKFDKKRLFSERSPTASPTYALSQLSTTQEDTGPTPSSLMPASAMTKKQGALVPFLHKLTQMASIVSANVSRKLQKRKCNYTQFLLEMQAAIWGMDHFGTYLRGRKFTLKIGQSAHKNIKEYQK
jgi:hypothetical protein